MTQNDPNPCCHESRENIPWLVNGTLSGPAAFAVRAHIKDCRECHADLQVHTEMRIAVLGNEVTPLMPTTRSADVIGVGGSGQRQHMRNRRSRPRLVAIAAGIAIVGVAIVTSFYAIRVVEETGPLFETATSAGSPDGIDYVMQLQFESGVADAERGRIAARLPGVVRWSVTDSGVYEVHVQLVSPSLQVLQEYEEHAVTLTGVQSAKFTALQLPMR